MRAFLAALCLGLLAACGEAAPPPAAAERPDCEALPAGLEQVRVAQVVDGDTVHLVGGEKVRLVGVNTPEKARDNRPAEPLAGAAERALEDLLAGRSVYLQPGAEPRDRHGRLLARLYTGAGSIEAALLRQGMGFHVAIAPNVGGWECLQAAEHAAREARRGVWNEAQYRPRRAAQLGRREGGFMLVRGEVTSVSFKDNGWWVQLDGEIGLRIDGAAQDHFRRDALRRLRGTEVEARGWLVPMGGWWQMRLGHPTMLAQLR